MTINHFLITAGYVFWAYIMLYIILKITFTIIGFSRVDKRVARIHELFTCENPMQIKKSTIHIIIYLTKSNIFFEELLKQYEAHKESFTKEQSDFFYKFIVRTIEFKILFTESSDTLTKALIIRAISACEVHSIKIDRFLTVSKTGSQIEKDWMRSYDELNKNVSEEKR